MNRFAHIATLILLTCTAASRADDLERLFQQLSGGANAPQSTATELRAAYDRLLDAAIDRIASDDLEIRQAAQRGIEKVCFYAGRPGASIERATLCEAIVARLDHSTPSPARVWLLRQLARIGGGESVPVLTLLLDDPNARIADLARKALMRNPSHLAAASLRTALDHASDPDKQIALIDAIGTGADPLAVPLLVQYLRADDSRVVSATLTALGTIATPDAIASLQKSWQDGSVSRRDVTADAMLRAADHLLDQKRHESAAEVAATLYDGATDTGTRCGALRILSHAESPGNAISRLLDIICAAQTPADLRAVAAELLAEIDAPDRKRTAALILDQMDSCGSVGEVLLLRALQDRGDRSALAKIRSRADISSDPATVVAAIDTVAALGGADDVRWMVKWANAGQPGIRQAARRALAEIHGEGVDKAMIDALADTAQDDRIALIRALGDRWCRDAVPALLDIARDTSADEAVRAAAIETIGVLGRPKQGAALVAVLSTLQSNESRETLEDAVVRLLSRVDDESARSAVPQVALIEADAATKCSLLRILGRLGGKNALGAVRTALDSNDADVVNTAVRVLSKWSSPAALDDLAHLAREGKEKRHRILALRGYIRLLGESESLAPAEALRRYRAALELATSVQEQRQILAGLAKVPHVETAELIVSLRETPGLMAEVDAALVTLAEQLALVDRAQTDALIDEILARDVSDATRQRAEKIRESMSKIASRLAGWMVTPPYTMKNAEFDTIYDTAFAPEEEGETVQWVPLRPTNREQPWIVDLLKLYGGHNRAVYVRTFVWSPNERVVQFGVGSDDAYKFWLNGEFVFENRVLRGHSPFSDRFDAKLRQGWNSVMLKIVQASGGWQFSAGIFDQTGEPMDDLRYSTRRPE